MKIRANIAEKVKEVMRERQKSLAELSEELDIPLTSLKDYAKGAANLRADTIEMLAEKLEITPVELISNLPPEWSKANALLSASQLFCDLPPEGQQKGIETFLTLVALFSTGGNNHE